MEGESSQVGLGGQAPRQIGGQEGRNRQEERNRLLKENSRKGSRERPNPQK